MLKLYIVCCTDIDYLRVRVPDLASSSPLRNLNNELTLFVIVNSITGATTTKTMIALATVSRRNNGAAWRNNA